MLVEKKSQAKCFAGALAVAMWLPGSGAVAQQAIATPAPHARALNAAVV